MSAHIHFWMVGGWTLLDVLYVVLFCRCGAEQMLPSEIHLSSE